MKIHTPKLQAIRFVGDFEKKLFEIGARVLPILKKGDIVVVNEIEATMLLRQPHFTRVDINTIFGDENQEDKSETSSEVVAEKLPFKEDLHNLTDEEIVLYCEKLGIKTGRRNIDTLKSILLSYLPSKEIQE